MKRKATVAIFGIGLGMVLLSCSTTGPNPSAAPPPIPPGGGAPFVTDGEAVAARMLFVAKCTKCHKFHDPANYNDKDWHKWFTKMSRKAKLESDQKELLSRYLEVFRSSTAANPPAAVR